MSCLPTQCRAAAPQPRALSPCHHRCHPLPCAHHSTIRAQSHGIVAPRVSSPCLHGSLSIPLQPEGFKMGVSMATERNGAGSRGCGRWSRAASGAGAGTGCGGWEMPEPLCGGWLGPPPSTRVPGAAAGQTQPGRVPADAFGAGKSRVAQLQPVYYGDFFPGKGSREHSRPDFGLLGMGDRTGGVLFAAGTGHLLRWA